MTEVSPYLQFDGTCAEAMRFYERCLNGKLDFFQTFGETPAKDHVPADWGDKVMHASLVVGGARIMASDAPPGQYARPQGLSVALSLPDAAESRRIFDALAEGGTVTMPFAETFWSPGFGMVVDRFGTPWMVNTAHSA